MGGGQKFRHLLGGVPIVERVRERVVPQVDELIVSVRGSGLEDLGMPMVFDAKPNDGPLAGIGAALAWVAARHGPASYLLSVSTDTPFLPRDLVSRLVLRLREADAEIATAASASGPHPTISLWSAALSTRLSSWLTEQSDRSVRRFIGAQRGVTVDFAGLIDPFFNINVPDDLATAEDLIRSNPDLSA